MDDFTARADELGRVHGKDESRRAFPGRATLERLFRRTLSERTYLALKFDLLRLRARLLHNRRQALEPGFPRLHLGSGDTSLDGWLNVDVILSDFDIDLAAGRLPWRDGAFEAVVSQHVVEHLELVSELVPLLGELRRVCADGAEIWLSCPDLERVCRSYCESRGADLLEDKWKKFPDFTLGPDDVPTQHMINFVFHEDGRHKNLYDFELLSWALGRAGFGDCRRVVEGDLLERFPDFPPREDDFSTLYVRAVAV